MLQKTRREKNICRRLLSREMDFNFVSKQYSRKKLQKNRVELEEERFFI